MKLKHLLILFAILAISACKKEESFWTISGNIVMQDAQIQSMTTPLAGINVYLLKAPFTMDTITNWFTKTDILDSTLTDAHGFYTFSQIQIGDYTVMPSDTSAGYRFDWSESPDPIWVLSDNTKKQFTMNFSTPEPIIGNSGFYEFQFNNYGEANKPRISLFRTCRVWKYKYWDWGPVFGWSDWYWYEFPSPSAGIWLKSGMIEEKDASNWTRQFTNEFHVKFFNNGTWLYTLAVDNLKDENIYDVHWQTDNVVVTRTN